MKTFCLKAIFVFIIVVYCNANCSSQTWNKVSDSIFNTNDTTPGGWVYTIKKIDSMLYVGGVFVNCGNMKVNGLAAWDGIKWDSIKPSSGPNSPTYDLCKYNNDIYWGGEYVYLMKWDGNAWFTVNTSLTTYGIHALKCKDKLFLGGSGFFLNSSNLHNIASWDGSDYAGLSGGVIGPFEHVRALAEYNNELIAGGVFNYAGGNVAFNIAAWNGSNWHTLDTGTAGVVNALSVDTINNFLYVGGGFTSAGGYNGINAYAIARWDGFQWDSLYTLSPSCDVMALCMYHNVLYAGMCGVTGSITDNILSKWNGKQWTRIEGPNEAVQALCVYNDELYVGGGFTMIGTDSVYGIARYCEPPDTTCDYLQAIIQPKNTVLNISDSTTVHFYNNIIQGSSWHWDFGDGATDTVRLPVHTYAGGGVFNISVIVTYQNCTDTAYTTITIVDDTGIKDNKNDSIEYLGQNIPNPFDNSTTIPYYVPNGSKGFLQITDAKGELVDEYALQQGKNTLYVSLEYLKSGTYFYSIIIDGKVMQTKKMVLE